MEKESKFLYICEYTPSKKGYLAANSHLYGSRFANANYFYLLCN